MSMDKINQAINEQNQGFLLEYTKPDGSTGVFNKLDFAVEKKFKNAKKLEQENRIYNHLSSIVALILVIMILMIAMIYMYCNFSTNISGIYFTKNGDKVELYHNKISGELQIKSYKGDRNGYVKKLNADTYLLYINSNANASDMTAIMDLNTGDIKWNNDLWKLDKMSFVL